MLRAFVYPFGICVGVTLVTILLLTLSGIGPTTINPITFAIALGVILLFGMLIGVLIGMQVINDIYDEER